MNLLLGDKVVWITGASGGIGRAMARAFADEGAFVALHGNRQWDELAAWVDEQPWRERALAVRADVTSESDVERAASEVVRNFGRIDIAIANAGIWPPDEVAFHEIASERLDEVFGVNLFGAMWTARAFLRQLASGGPRADGHGASLLFTGSTAGRFGELGHADYAASKAALTGLMATLKNEIVRLDPFGRVNLVEPGWTVTDMTRRNIHAPGVVEKVVRTMPMRQLARAQDIARTALFLSSPAAARHISGQVVTVAGGMEGRVLWEEEAIEAKSVIARLDPQD